MLWLAGWIYWVFSNTYFRLMPLSIINGNAFDQVDSGPLKGIMVPWHCYIPYGWWLIRNRNGAVMISQSNWGTVASAITSRLGCIPVRGGSKIGGEMALSRIISYVKKGHWAMIIGDGPRGPRHECKIGPIFAAQQTGQPIVPVSFSARWKWNLNTWDRMIIPKPFSPVLLIYGEPLYVARDLDRQGLEEKRRELECIMRRNHQRAESYWKKGSGAEA